MLSYCEISAMPAFRTLVSELTPTLGEKAEREAYRDYMEHDGNLREASEIISKQKNDYFSTVASERQAEKSADAEILMSKKDMFEELGTSVPKKQISSQQIITLKKRISRTNNEFHRHDISKVYTLETKQVGQSDNFTWEVKAYKGTLDAEGKLQRLNDVALDDNTLPSKLRPTVAYKQEGEQSTLSFHETGANYSQQLIRKLADALGQQIGVDYAFITPVDATEITKDSQNPWTGQKSFFFKGKTYFIAGELTPSDILHEFIHPVIKSISKQNRPLFTALYDKLAASQEGATVIDQVRKLYPDLTENADDFKEEVLVRSLENMADLNSKNLQVTAQFQKFINDLLYAIKQFLRKHLGQKIAVSDLDVNTTLQELSTMLQEGESFQLDPEIISDADLVAYKNEYNKYISDISAKKIDQKEMEDLADKYFTAVKQYIHNAKSQSDLGPLEEILYNKFKTGGLDVMSKNLKSYQDMIMQDAKKMEDEVELTRERTMAIINSLGNLDNTVTKLLEGLKEMVKDIDNQDNIQRVQYYNKFLNYWSQFAKDARTTLEHNGVQVPFINNLNANIDRANDLIENYYEKAAKQTLVEVLSHTAQNIDAKWAQRLVYLKSKNAPQGQIDTETKDYNDKRITPELIENALKGNIKDIGLINVYMEAAGYNPDPVVGGLSLFIKNGLTEADSRIQSRFNDMMIPLKPMLDKNNYNANSPGKIGELLGKREKVGSVNKETGEFEEKEVWVFKNQFTGAQVARERYQYRIRKAREKYKETKSEADRAELAAIQAEHEQHERDYFHGPHTEEFNQAYDKLGKDEIGNEARLAMNDLYDDLNRLAADMYTAGTEDILNISDLIEIKRREIKQLASLYDLGGNLKTGRDLEIAQRIQAFNEAIKDLYTSEEIPGAFQEAYSAFEQKLKDEGKNPSEIAIEMTKWLEKNGRVSIKDEFWTKMDRISRAIKEIMAEIPQQEEYGRIIDEAYQEMKSLVRGARDESGQPLGSEMSPEKQEKIRQCQIRIDDARDQLARVSGLTKFEQDEISSILARLSYPGTTITSQESLRLSILFDKQSALRLDKIQRAELNSLFSELDDLRTKEPTDAYLDTVNNLLDNMSSDAVVEILGTTLIDKGNAYRLGGEVIAERLMAISPEYKEWFERNHTIQEKIDWETQEPYISYQRTYAWNVIKPKDSKYYDSTTITKADGTEETLPVLPSLKYFKRLVKDEYKTQEIVGVTKDNRGYWLPKTFDIGDPRDRYMDKDYARLKASNSEDYQLLEEVKKQHLKNQEGLHRKHRLDLEFPRFPKQFVERMQSNNLFDRLIQRIKDIWIKAKYGWESGFNADAEANLVKMDLFDDEMNDIPIAGLYNLDIEEVSTDVITNVLRYMASAERNKQLTKMAPVARMIQKVVNNKDNHPVQKKVMNNSTLIFTNRKKEKYYRAEAVNNFIEKTFEGQVNKGWGADHALAHNFSNFVFKRASSAFLGLNIPSAIKNAIGMKFQGMVEALAGKNLNWRDYIAAEVDATETAILSISEIYNQGPKSEKIQIVELFDPDRDRFHFHFGESVTRTAAKDYSYLILNRFNDFRRITQLQAGLQVLFGMMRHEKIKTADGKTISYNDAWIVKDGKIQLKDNVPAEWGITYDKDGNQVIGEKFKQKRLEYQRVIDNCNGAMSKEDRPEAERYLLFRYISFFRRFLTSMLMNRIAKNRRDYQLADTKEGFYRTTVKLMWDTMRNMGRNLPYMTQEQKAASMRMLGDVGFTMLLKYVILATILGYDDEDEDRFKKLRANSGALPLWFTEEDPSRPFDLGGWLENHAVLQTMQVAGENSQFLPFPGWGLNNFKDFFNIKSMAMGPTVNSYFDIIGDAYYIATDNEKARYKRTAGAYEWNQEGNLKVWNHIGKMFGFTSSTIDPAIATRNYVNVQAR